MKKSDFLKLCEDHAVNPRAMKRKLHEDGLYRRTATKYEVLRCMFIHCTDLMFCRQSDFADEVEYADKYAPMRLINAMSKAEHEVQS